MVIKALIAFEAVKEMLASVWKIVKKYWQIFVGFIVGVATLLLFRGRSSDKVAKDLNDESRKQRDEIISIAEDKSEKVDQAVREFIENESKASERHEDRISEIKSEADRIKSDLLEKEADSPGAIADEINKIVK